MAYPKKKKKHLENATFLKAFLLPWPPGQGSLRHQDSRQALWIPQLQVRKLEDFSPTPHQKQNAPFLRSEQASVKVTCCVVAFLGHQHHLNEHPQRKGETLSTS